MLCSQDYPDERYEVWVIDDNSTDKNADVVGTTKAGIRPGEGAAASLGEWGKSGH